MRTPRPLLQFFLGFGVISAAGLTWIVATAWSGDPYWLRQHGGHGQTSEALDLRMRFVKAAQLIERRPSLLLVGSSTVYRGLDPAVLEAGAGPAYNLGISGLRLLEARHYIEHALTVAPVQHVTLGLEFYMFDRNRRVEPGFDPRLGNMEGVLVHALGPWLSLQALRDARRALSLARTDPDGRWTRMGYKQTNPRSAQAVREQMAWAKSLYQRTDTSGEEAWNELARIVAACQAGGARLTLYLTPFHASYTELIAAAGQGRQLATWRERLVATARRNNIELLDLSANNPAIDTPLDAHNAFFTDPSHFSRLHGYAIMAALGLPVSATARAEMEDAGLGAIGRRTTIDGPAQGTAAASRR